MTNKVIFLTTTGAGTWTVPADWTNVNKIECIGGGGGGRISAAGGGGGGGGAYSSISNTSAYSAGNVIDFSVGTGGASGGNGNDTWFGATSLASSLVGAKGGTGSTGTAGGAGGLNTSGFPTSGGVRNSGGAGGTGNASIFTGGGGGGAGGPGGTGGLGGNGDATASGADFGGGGGSGAGTSTAGGGGGAGTTSAGAGGTNANGGGPGGAGGNGTGVTPTEPATGMWTSTHAADTTTVSVAQASTGGGGGGGGSATTGSGGNGSFYGGGGGGAGVTTSGGSARQGIIIITYEMKLLATMSATEAADTLVGPPTSVDFSYQSNGFGTDANTNSSPWTIGTGKAIGAAASNRRVWIALACVYGVASPALTCTIGGVSVTFTEYIRDTTTSLVLAVGYADVPTGTTANVVLSGQNFQLGYYGYWLFRILTDAPTPTSSGNDPTGTDTADLALTVPTGGAAIWVAGSRFHTSGLSLTGTNIVEATGSPNYSGSGASDAFQCGYSTTAGSTTCTLSGAGTDIQGMVGAAVGPGPSTSWSGVVENPTNPTGTMSVTEAADTANFTGVANSFGTLSVTEAADTATFTGWANLIGTMSVTESADTAAFTAVATTPGTMSATEGADTAAFIAVATTPGTLSVTEAYDIATFTGKANAFGTLSVIEAADIPAFTAVATTPGTMSATEAYDIAAFTGYINAFGTLSVTETADIPAFTGVVNTTNPTGSLSVTEAADTASFPSGVVTNPGSMSVTEGADTAAFIGKANAFGTMSATEGADTSAFTGVVTIPGTLSVIEAADAATFTGYVVVRGTLQATEAADTATFTGIISAQIFGPMSATEAPDSIGGITYIPPTLIDTLPMFDSLGFTVPSPANWTGKNLGDANVNNWVVAVLNLYTAAAPSGMTIGGVTATLVRERVHSVWGNNRVQIWKANVPAGGAGLVQLTWPGFVLDKATGALYKMRTTDSVPSDGNDADGGLNYPYADASATLNIPPGGGAVWVGGLDSDSTSPSDTLGTPLSGAGVTDDYSPATPYYCSAGSSTLAGSRTATRPGGNVRPTIAGVAWTPAGGGAWTGIVADPPVSGTLSVIEAVDTALFYGNIVWAAVNTMRVRDAGIWKTPLPRVKSAGAWVTPLTAWVKDAGDWKKVFDVGPGGGGAFTMPTYTNKPLNTTAHTRIVVAGYGVGKTATISGSGATFRKNGGAFGTTNLTVSDGDVIDVIWPCSGSYNTQTTCTVTIDGLARTGFATTSINAAANILAFWLNPLSHSAESALGGDWASHQTKWQANRRSWSSDYGGDWGGGASAWDPPDVYWLMRYLRGSGNSADTSDVIAYMNDYNTDMPNAWHSSDAWRLGHAHYVDYIYNSRNFNQAGRRMEATQWQYGLTPGLLDPTYQYWTTRYLTKEIGSIMSAVWAGVPNGSYGGVLPATYPGGPPAMFRALIDKALTTPLVATNDGWAGLGMYYWPLRWPAFPYGGVPYSKPWQESSVVRELIFAYHHFYPYDDTLKTVILGACEFLWNCCIQYSVVDPATPSTTSGKWASVYNNRFSSDEGTEGNLNHLVPELSGFQMGLFGYAYYLTGDVTWRNRLRGLLKGMVADAWYTAGAGNTVGNKIMCEMQYTQFASYFDSQTYPAPSFPVCSADPAGSISGGTFTITSDGTWSGSPTSTQYEIWKWNAVTGASGAIQRAASASSVSTSGLSGWRLKGRVRKWNASGWGAWADTNWSTVP